jgi:hypothetical protein
MAGFVAARLVQARSTAGTRGGDVALAGEGNGKRADRSTG